MSMKDWSTTAASNATIASNSGINWQEGQAPSTVNDSARAMMSDVRAWYEAAEWIDLGHAPTYASGTSFTVPGDKTAIYTVGRRVKVYNGSSTFYATISAVGFSTNTTVTVVNDGSALSGTLSTVAVGIINPANSSEIRTHSGTHTFSSDAVISGITVGKGVGAVSTNTAVGVSAMAATASGIRNTGLGYVALTALTTGAENTGLGAYALTANTTGGYNTALGSQTLIANTSGSYNVAVGWNSLAANTTGSGNIAVGYNAGYSLAAGVITAVGHQAGYQANGASGHLTAFGYQAGYGYTSVSENSSSTYIGFRSGYSGTITGRDNTLVGGASGYSMSGGSTNAGVGCYVLFLNTTGSNNAVLGYYSMANNTTGSQNTAVGREALQANTTASSNTAVGYQALYNNATGTNLTAIGYRAGWSATGDAGTYMGRDSGYYTTGAYNTFIGFAAGNLITTGAKNTILGGYSGNQGGLDIRTASNYIVLSDGDGNPRIAVDNNGSTMLGGAVSLTPGNQNGSGFTGQTGRLVVGAAGTGGFGSYAKPSSGGSASFVAINNCAYRVTIYSTNSSASSRIAQYIFVGLNKGGGSNPTVLTLSTTGSPDWTFSYSLNGTYDTLVTVNAGSDNQGTRIFVEQLG